ncbi:hypothetical protein K470DRAFT_262332 [Piedraia hortae CBS 480.64]|uniref:RING-type domain-containing protein n=1 Tax=Piedraia hortae CBS 480.64 TaxID=1314780 RepID=A0A6A7C6V7_9PEZI|nr:hypothetical protein K470DRAFT_262332 [Piedraia hortae CBS 480.64]
MDTNTRSRHRPGSSTGPVDLTASSPAQTRTPAKARPVPKRRVTKVTDGERDKKRRRSVKATTSTSPSAAATAPPSPLEAEPAGDDPQGEDEALRAEQLKSLTAQQTDAQPNSRLKIGQRTCIICMETFTNITVTHCGHIYCHECLLQALKIGERNAAGIGHCPMCRQTVRQKKGRSQGQIYPVSFMKRSEYKRRRSG